MKINIKEKEFKVWLGLTLVITIIWLIFVSMILQSGISNKRVFLDEELKRFQGEVNSTLITYEEFSNFIFDEINQDAEIISIMHQANYALEEEKTDLRDRLYNKLHEKYLTMKKYKYRQFHFHLPNTESFLRVHQADKYGDLLSPVRESVRLANKYQTNVVGFEEGRIFNGFRYVYPLEYNNLHIGSVEISISTGSIIEVLSKLYKDRDFYFIIDKTAVKENVFDEEMTNYKDSSIFTDYYVDKEVDEITNYYNKLVPNSRDLFFKSLKDKYSNKSKDKESFSSIMEFNNKNYTVMFSSIENLKKEPIAYLISISESNGYEKFNKDIHMQIILLTILLFAFIIFAWIVASYQQKLKKASDIDYLTKIYNRKKFYEIVDREAKYTKRYKYDSSIMIMDIDYFKDINDKYGHEWGDKVLVELASKILKNIRNTDVFARWGGEEFVLLLPHTKKKDAILVAEKIRKLIDESQSKILKEITLSIGVAGIDPENYNIDESIKLADKAMYSAKENGRNQVWSN